jgi:Na+/H+-dicarboxylate symporter
VSLATRVLAGLVAGFALGLALARWSPAAAPAIAAFVAPAGTIFINLIRMTVMPLITSMLIAGVASFGATSALSRTAMRAAAIALVLIAVAAAASAAIAQPILARVSIDRAAAEALRPRTTARLTTSIVPASEPAPVESPIARCFIDLVPANVVKAVADDAMLPVIVFALLFGLALARVGEARRNAVLRVVEGIAETMQHLVGGILVLAPIGVFALAVPLAVRLGYAIAGAVVVYIVLVVVLTVAGVVLMLYPLGIVAGGMPVARFAAFCAPSQAVAFSARSSLAALPAMVKSAEEAGMPTIITGVIVPISASMFRFGAAVAQTVGVLFIARLYDVPLSAPQLATVTVTVIATTFAVPGIPGGSILAMVPVLRAASVPIEGIGILLAVDTIPDMFRTMANTTGMMTLAAVLGRETSLRNSSY